MSDRVELPQSYLDTIAGLLAEAEQNRAEIEEARQAATTGYDTGFALGHDTGLGARPDSKGFVHGLLAGYSEGVAERQRLVRELSESRRQQPQRRAPEHELEAG